MSRENPQGASFTWEEISWITGIPVVMLLEIFSAGLQAKGVNVSELPPALDGDALAAWLRSNPGLLHEVA
jgi:hypothetical protein